MKRVGPVVDATGPEADPAKPRGKTGQQTYKLTIEAKMTREQYHEACRSLNLSPTYGAARALGISQSSASRYANGRPIPETVARLLRALMLLGRTDV
jgi:hypothetical protein